MGLTQYLVDHEALSTCCHVGRHVNFLTMQASLVSDAFVSLGHLLIRDRAQNLYIACQEPLSSDHYIH